jgi:glycine/D-amino acid oxidase-like deaminating enzyme
MLMVQPQPVTQMPSHSPEHAPSWYAASVNRYLEFPALAGEISADVCIVGGGYTGLNCAIELARRGYAVALLEARQIGWGASGRNGGQLIRGVGHEVERFRGVLGDDGVRRLKLYGLEAVELVRRRVEEFAIDCDLRWGYCDLANRPEHLDGFRQARDELLELGYPHELRLLQAGEMHQVVGSERYCGGLTWAPATCTRSTSPWARRRPRRAWACSCSSVRRRRASTTVHRSACIARADRCAPTG